MSAAAVDPDLLMSQTLAYVDGVQAITCSKPDDELVTMTSWQLRNLLEPVRINLLRLQAVTVLS